MGNVVLTFWGVDFYYRITFNLERLYFRLYGNYYFQRSGIVGSKPETRTWAKMTDKFGGKWALVDLRWDSNWAPYKNVLRICSMKNLTKNKPVGVL